MVVGPEINGTDTDIYVARYDASVDVGSWVALGGSLSAGGISGSGNADNAQILNTDSGLMVFWLDSSSGTEQVYAKRFDGSTWVEIGAGSATVGGISQSTGDVADLAVTTDGPKVAVAWTEIVSGTQQIYLKEYNGSVWAELSGSASGGGLSNLSGASRQASLAYHAGELFVAWQQQIRSDRDAGV